MFSDANCYWPCSLLQCKIYCEKIRLGELKQECLPPDLRVSPMNMFQSPEPQNKCTLENED